MSTNTIDTEKTTTPEPGAPQAKGKQTAAKETVVGLRLRREPPAWASSNP
jgi:hypothetical protein